MLALLLMAWGKGSAALTDRFAEARQLWAVPGAGQTYQGFLKAWRRTGLGLAYAAAAQLRSQMAALAGTAAWTVEGWCVRAADGSRFELPRTAEHQRVFGVSGQAGSGPQLWVTMLWHLGLGLPWAWKVGRVNASERHHLRGMLRQTPAGSLLVMDAGFTGYELLRAILGSPGGRHLLVRVGRKVELLRRLGYVEQERDGTVYLWPTYAQRRAMPPLTLRLIRLPRCDDRRRKMYLLTSVRDPARLSDAAAQRIYRRRWGIELAYRTLKQTLAARQLRSHAPAPALLEIHGLLLGLTLLGLWTRRALAGAGAPARRWSPAGALRLVRRGLHRPGHRLPWTEWLAGATIDSYRRRHKVRRAWPRKKQHDAPPGAPALRPATSAERRRALALKAE